MKLHDFEFLDYVECPGKRAETKEGINPDVSHSARAHACMLWTID
jgi:hypothetical protein